MSLPPSKDARIFVTGHRGMVGSAIVRRLQRAGYTQVITRSHAELDLLDQRAVFDFLAAERPEYVFMAAAKVGGIHANNVYRGEFLYQNLVIQANLIEGAHRAGVQRLMFLGSSCIYPRDCPQPIREDYLLTGPLEQTNEPYAIAKITGIKLCESYNAQYGRQYVSVMPTNLYGPNDNYDLANSHVLPALIRKAHEARLRGDAEYVVWGTGTPRREFLYVDDLADACVYLMEQGYDGPLVNIGTGQDVTIRELAENRDEGRRLRGPHRVRREQARRHAAQAARRLAPGQPRLDGAHHAARRHPSRLSIRSLPRGHPVMTSPRKVALITGVTGQDGAYLAELLLSKGYDVHGIKRRASSFNTDRIDHLYQDPHEENQRFRLHYGDLTDSTNLIRIVQQVQPDEIYNLAAR